MQSLVRRHAHSVIRCAPQPSTAASRLLGCFGRPFTTTPIHHSTVKEDPLGLYTSLSDWDPELHGLIVGETQRQRSGLELIASENFVSGAVLECLGSILTNKYAEGRPGLRYYGGVEFVDQVERLAERRALKAFHLSPSEWAVNVQPYSGSPANFAVYVALLTPEHSTSPNEKTGGLMGLHLTCGGHLTHGFFTPQKKVSASALFFRSTPYFTDPNTGYIDYDGLAALARTHRPEIIIAGGSAYPRDWELTRIRETCDEVGALMMFDMAHTAGLIAAEEQNNPFLVADIVTTTTHKTLRGPRAGIIFARKTPLHGDNDALSTNLAQRIHAAVFPGLQGGPHLHQIAAIATQMKAVGSPAWKVYAQEIRQNTQFLAAALQKRGQVLVTGGSDNHLLLWDLRPHLAVVSWEGFSVKLVEHCLEALHMSVNRNTLPGDAQASSTPVPNGIRLGTAALTTRGVLREAEWDQVGDFLVRGLELCKALRPSLPSASPTGGKRNALGRKAYLAWLHEHSEVEKLRKEVEAFALQFSLPGA